MRPSLLPILLMKIIFPVDMDQKEVLFCHHLSMQELRYLEKMQYLQAIFHNKEFIENNLLGRKLHIDNSGL